MKNSFGNLFRVTTFGESHGGGLGAVIDGCPSRVPFDLNLLLKNLERRRPGNFSASPSDAIVSQRKEEDQPEILSGVFEGFTLGTPIAIFVRNKDTRSQDYQEIALKPRIGHADDVWKTKYGHVDYRGGGRSSGRETVARVIAGSIAEMYLKTVAPHIKIIGYSSQIGPIKLTHTPDYQKLSRKVIDQSVARFPDPHLQTKIENLLLTAQSEGKSYGGKVDLIISGAPAGLGQPVFHKLKADLAAAFLGIGATSSVEIGSGTHASEDEGSEFHQENSPRYGGIRGGISTGEDIITRITFKPTASVLDVAKKGRHDPCIITRAIPVIEAMATLVLTEHFMWQQLDRIEY